MNYICEMDMKLPIWWQRDYLLQNHDYQKKNGSFGKFLGEFYNSFAYA